MGIHNFLEFTEEMTERFADPNDQQDLWMVKENRILWGRVYGVDTW